MKLQNFIFKNTAAEFAVNIGFSGYLRRNQRAFTEEIQYIYRAILTMEGHWVYGEENRPISPEKSKEELPGF